MDFHQSVNEKMVLHSLLPGYDYTLQDPVDAFYFRKLQSFSADQQSYNKNRHGKITITNNEALLDPSNSFIQAYLTFGRPVSSIITPQFLSHNAPNSLVGGFTLNQLASSVMRRILVRAGGQVLCDLENFMIYHHVMKLRQADQCDPAMAYYTEASGDNAVTLATATDYTIGTLHSPPELQKYQRILAQTQIDGVATYTNDNLVIERLKEDIKRSFKYYKMTTPITSAPDLNNLNIFYNLRENDPKSMSILFKLSDLPSFIYGQYFPLFAINGPLVIEWDGAIETDVFHALGINRGSATTPSDLANLDYQLSRVEAMCSLIYPKPNWVDQYMAQKVATGQSSYKCAYIESTEIAYPTSTSTLLYNVSMARLFESFYIKRNVQQNVIAPDEKRYTVADTDASAGKLWRGAKWYLPWNPQDVYVKVNGVSYPDAHGSAIISEQLMLEQTEQALGKLHGLKDKDRFFFDSQILGFNFKKDTHSHQLMDVSGVNTSNNNQLQLVINAPATARSEGDTIVGFHAGEQIIYFTTSGAVLTFR